MKKTTFLKTLCLFICSMIAMCSTTTAQLSKIVPPTEGIPLLTTARYSVISSLLIKHPFDSFEHVLLSIKNLSDKEKLQLMIKYSNVEKSLDNELRSVIKKYRIKNGWLSSTGNQAKLYAIEEKMGLDSYIKARYLFIAEITEEYDFSHLSLSIDNNIPVILQDGGNIYLCLAYDDSSITVADMAKITGLRVLPGWSSRVTELKKAKNLSDSDQKWLEEHEEKLRNGDYQAEYVDYYFNPHSAAAGKLNRPFLSRLPRGSFQGKMTIITPPKMEFDKIIKRFGGW